LQNTTEHLLTTFRSLERLRSRIRSLAPQFMPLKPSALSTLESRGHWGIKKGLDNIRLLLGTLGHPEKSFPAILIAGTNGKGSTGAFLAYALKSAGVKVGWTTSPHLLSPTERIWIDGHHVSEEYLDSLLKEVLDAESSCGVVATYFELMVSAALLAFGRAPIDLALVEVGMGGRWDSTNVLEPILTILTNVALDHTAHLGDTLDAIATEKLCTARDSSPLVLGPGLDPQWLSGLCETKPQMKISLLPDAEIFWDHSIVNGHRINLAGAHQISNLATALKALDTLTELGWELDKDCIYQGLSKATWPGRLWSAPELTNTVFDGAHNVNGAEALAEHIKHCGIRPHLFFSAMGDKDLCGMARALASTKPLSVTLVLGEESRYASPEAMQVAWSKVGHIDLPLLTLGELATKLKANATEQYIVTGSLYFLGHLLKKLKELIAKPPILEKNGQRVRS
jgi:dihydrofolate synthase/folylpolyglutamate synthase